ncbi:MAG: SDR family NAD(P)-dependent oxidoreductase [Tenuifilaceae bacterium]|nr:SDR family NAD(P)-dependent oxidoreductase [Tenuifilaceae bacterium]
MKKTKIFRTLILLLAALPILFVGCEEQDTYMEPGVVDMNDRITSIDKDIAQPGDIVTLTGTNLDKVYMIMLNTENVPVSFEATATELKMVVPGTSPLGDVITINIFFSGKGLAQRVKSFLPHFLKRPEAHILNVASMGGFLPVPGQSIYGAAKSAVKLFTEALYAELMNTNVHVTIVFPGAIATNITANSGIDIPKSAEGDQKKSGMKTLPASEAAKQILDAMEKNKFRALIGSDAKFMDFIYRLSPKFATGFIAKKMAGLLK